MNITAYKQHLIENEKSSATVEKYMRGITAFMVWLNGRELDKGKVLEYKERLIASYALRSINSIISSLNSYFDYAIKKDIVRLADILGHASINTTRIYTMESGEVHRRHIEQMNLLLC